MSTTNLSKVAVVTGGNKGIGFSVVKGLAKDFNGQVYLTGIFYAPYVVYSFSQPSIFLIARNVELGLAAIDRLNDLGLKANFHQLDIDDIESIRTFASYLKDKYGGLDVLVNNAGVAFHVRDLNYRISIKNFLTFSIDLIYFLDNE